MAHRKSSRVSLRLESLETREVPAAIAALDPSFGTGGKIGAPGAPFAGVALQPDGKIVTVGTSNGNFLVARFNPDGSLDSSFDTDGIQTIDFGGTESANGLAIQPNGSIVVVGTTSVGTSIAVARLTSTGALDTSFDADGKLTIDLGTSGESGNAVALQADGKIVIAGSTGADFAVVRVNGIDGSLDGSFGTGGKKILDLGGSADAANAIAIQANGSIVLAGTTGLDFAIARLTTSGALDTSFVSVGKLTFDLGGVDIARGIALQPDGKIVVVGSNGSDMAIVRLLPANGAFDTSFDVDGKQTVNISGPDDARAVQLQQDGKILLVGDTGTTASDLAIARLTSAGALDTTFNGTGKLSFDVTGTSFLDLGTAAVLTPQGRLIVAGKGGGSFVNGLLVRVPVELEDPRQLAVGGTLDGRAMLYGADASSGKFGVTALASIVAFGTTNVNARVAVGDVNGDGFEDIAVVTGPGTALRLAVVSGKNNTTLLVAPFDPFGGTFTGGGFVSTADFDNDGRSEVIVTPDQGGGPRVTIFSLATDGSFNVRANFFGIDDPAFRGGARTAAGDINGDGYADLAVSAGFQGGPRVALFNGATIFSASRTKLTSDFFAFDPSLRNGVFVTIGDTNGDGFGDLYFGAGPGGAPRVMGISGGSLLSVGATAAIAAPLANFFLAGNASNRGGVRLVTTDADGDGKADVVAGTGEGQASFTRVYFGKYFGAPGEPTGFQDLDPFSGAVLAKGIFVG